MDMPPILTTLGAQSTSKKCGVICPLLCQIPGHPVRAVRVMTRLEDVEHSCASCLWRVLGGASGDPKALATLAAHGVRCSTRDLISPPDHANLPAVVGHAVTNLERRDFIARGPVHRIGRNATMRDVRLLPVGRAHAEVLAVLREFAPGELAGPVRKPRQPDLTTDTRLLWQGLEPKLAVCGTLPSCNPSGAAPAPDAPGPCPPPVFLQGLCMTPCPAPQ